MCITSVVSKRISYWYTSIGANSGSQKRKCSFIYSDIFHCRLCVFLLNLSSLFSSKKTNFVHCKPSQSIKKSSAKGFYLIDDCQHFNIELLGVLSSSNTTCCAGNSITLDTSLITIYKSKYQKTQY